MGKNYGKKLAKQITKKPNPKNCCTLIRHPIVLTIFLYFLKQVITDLIHQHLGISNSTNSKEFSDSQTLSLNLVEGEGIDLFANVNTEHGHHPDTNQKPEDTKAKPTKAELMRMEQDKAEQEKQQKEAKFLKKLKDTFGDVSIADQPDEDAEKANFYDHDLAVMIISSREAYQARNMIRKTWASGQKNVFFIVGDRYCEIPKQYRANRVDCSPAMNYSLARKDEIKEYLEMQETANRKLQMEENVVLIPVMDTYWQDCNILKKSH